MWFDHSSHNNTVCIKYANVHQQFYVCVSLLNILFNHSKDRLEKLCKLCILYQVEPPLTATTSAHLIQLLISLFLCHSLLHVDFWLNDCSVLILHVFVIFSV